MLPQLYIPRLLSATFSCILSIILIYRIRSFKTKKRIHWTLLEYLGYADVGNAVNFIFAAILQIVITPQSIQSYRQDGYPTFAYVLFPLGYFTGFLQLSFNAMIPWLLYEYLFSFASYRNHTELYLQHITKLSVIIALVASSIFSCVLLVPMMPLEVTMTITTGYGTLSSTIFLIILLYGYRRLRIRVNNVLKDQADQQSFLRSVLLRGLLYTVTYIVSWMPLNLLRLANVTKLMPVPEESRLWLDVLGGSAGIINSLAFFVSERTFPFVCNDPDMIVDTPPSNSFANANTEQAGGKLVKLINTSDINVESGEKQYLYEESTPSNYNEFYDDVLSKTPGNHNNNNNFVDDVDSLSLLNDTATSSSGGGKKKDNYGTYTN
jgi:hypothetical protein